MHENGDMPLWNMLKILIFRIALNFLLWDTFKHNKVDTQKGYS
jgi:hypothetical protein